MVGNHKLHPNCFIVCAGNREEDNAIVNDLGTAMQSRLIHINVCVDNDVWLKNVALKENYDPRIIAYIKSYPEDLMNFNPEHTEQTFASPRTWSFANTLIKDKKSFTLVEEALVIGCLGMSVGSKFITYTKIFKDIPVFEDILKEPETINIPDELNKQWALLCMVMQKVDEDNLSKLIAFIDRFDTSFKVLFYKAIFMRNDSLKSNKLVRSKIMEIAQYVYD